MYPYKYRSTILGINHHLIFVVMPFATCLDEIYVDLIKPAADELDSRLGKNNADSKYFTYRTKDDLRTSSGWINVMKHLFTAQMDNALRWDFIEDYFLGSGRSRKPPVMGRCSNCLKSRTSKKAELMPRAYRLHRLL